MKGLGFGRALGAACAVALGAGAVMAQQPQVPRPSPDFTIQFVDGHRESLGQYRGKVVALEFLFTT